MAISLQVLGAPGYDNALFIRIDTGQKVYRLLFDCGEDCLKPLTISEIMEIDHLCFSHYHMDHICGFDSFFRINFGRTERPNHIWGPSNTSDVLTNRLRSYWWNLTDGHAGQWQLHSIQNDAIATVCLKNGEQFQVALDQGSLPFVSEIVSYPDYTIEAMLLEHRGPSVAYLVRERDRTNLDVSRLAELGMRPGAWVRQLKEAISDEQRISIDGKEHSAGDLKRQLLVETPGDSVAYVTDFLPGAPACEGLSRWLSGCGTLVCEAQYRHADYELSQRNYHATTTHVAELAKAADVKRLMLFHLSDRYTADEWREMLREAQAIFPATQFPAAWSIT